MADLPDLAYDLDGFLFGTGSKYIVQDVEYGPVELTTNDSPLPRADGIRFGRDYRQNRVITFEIAINQSPHHNGALVLDLLANLERAWMADPVRQRPGAVSSLRMARNGRTRRIFGRPRQFATTSERSKGGWVYCTAEFETVDPYFYSDSERSNTVSIVPTSGGGLLAPLAAPLITDAISYGPGDVVVGGLLPAWPVFLIHGPINQPRVNVIGEWSFTLNLNLAGDEYVVIDTRPWSRGVRRNGIANVGGYLDANAPRLSLMQLQPGPHEIVLSGQDSTGRSYLSVVWRETFPTY